MSNGKYRYRLEVFYKGEWRKLFGSDKRIDLDLYVSSCTDPDVQFRIIDEEEEEVNAVGRYHKPR